MVKDLCFEIIDKCPNNCKFCSSNSCINRNTIISYEDFKKVIDYFISKGGIEELSLSGGEPFLHPDLFKMISYSKGLGIKTVVFTSGIKKKDNISLEKINNLKEAMNKKVEEVKKNEPWNQNLINKLNNYYENIINSSEFSGITKEELFKLKNIGLDKIVFDFQAYEHTTDEYLMGRNRDKFNCLLDSLLHASFVGLETDVHFIPMKPNYKEIGDILELLEIAKIKNISILNFVPQGRGAINENELILTQEELNEFMNLLESYKNKFSGNVRIGIPLQGENSHLCNAGLEKLDIKFDGTILPCPAFKELDEETMKRFGIKYYNIYENLEDVKTPGGKRAEPLCRRVYKRK